MLYHLLCIQNNNNKETANTFLRPSFTAKEKIYWCCDKVHYTNISLIKICPVCGNVLLYNGGIMLNTIHLNIYTKATHVF